MPSLNRIRKVRRYLFVPILIAIMMPSGKATAQSSIADMKKSSGESTLPTVIMPSPNSATLTRNISDHVDLYTGKLSVEIPIYSLKSRNIELPISLQAVANAHHVNDIGSWVGLGWHLNAGGVITRVMKNLPDEWNGTISPSFNFPGIGYINLNTAAGGYTLLERFAPVSIPLNPSSAYTVNEMKNIIHRGSWNTKNNPPDKGFDLQPDQFYFNFGKFSGQFVFSNSGEIRLITEANVFITPTVSAGKITGFTVNTDDGYTYEFGNYALNAVEDSKLSVSSKTMTWTYLYKGCPYAKEYPYDDGEHPTQVLQNIVHFIYDGSPVIMSYDAFQTAAGPYIPNNLMDFSHPNNLYNAEYFTYPSSWYLTKITSPTGDFITLNYINNGTFTYVTDRTFTSSEPVKGTHFPSPEVPCTGFESVALSKNVFGIPGFAHYPSFGDYSISTNTITLTSKKLKEIVTSQGYKVEFISTTNRQDLPGDKRLDKISISNNGALVKEFLLDYETVQNSEAAEVLNWNVRVPKYNFNVNHTYLGLILENQTRQHIGTIDPSWRYRMYLTSIIEKGANQETLPAYTFDYFNKADLPFRTSINQDQYGFAKDAGTAPVFTKLLAGVLKSAKYPTGGHKEFEYEVSGNATAWNGLRIKSIKEFESTSATVGSMIKNYAYGTFQQSDQALISYTVPDIVLELPVGSGGATAFVPIASKFFQSSSRVNPQMLTKGAAGGYSFVEISQPNNGLTRVEFTPDPVVDFHTPTILVSGLNGGFTKNLNTIGVYYPFPEKTSNEWQRGLPYAEYVIAQDGKKIRSTHYDFDFTNNASGSGETLGMEVTKYRIDFGVDWNWLTYGRYSYQPKWQLLLKQTIREYAANGTDYRETIVENTYDKPIYANIKQLLFLRENKLSNSKNEQVVQKFRYPIDYNTTTDAFGLGITQLKAKNILSAVVEKYQYVQNPNGTNRRYVGGMLNKYYSDKPLLLQSFSLQPAATLTSFTESYINGSSFAHDPNYKSIQNFISYTSYGGIKEQNEESDVKESYIWDHNDTYPVAKVTNAASSDIAYSSFEADGKGNWTYSSVHIREVEKGVTGKKYYSIPASGLFFGFINSDTLSVTKKYKLTFWNKYGYPVIYNYASGGGNTAIPVSGLTPLITINGWRYYEIDIENSVRVEVAKYSNAGPVYVDELRLFPKNAQMTTYTFDVLVGMTSQCDPNNRIVYYEYDGLQRLRLLKDQYGNVTKTYDYNYKQ